jgi:glutamyl endopeptidase
MATSETQATGPDTAVSNVQDESELNAATPSREDPDHGQGADVDASGDHEVVDGWAPSEAAPAVTLERVLATEGLADIGEASFGPPPPSAETVHGVDNRVQITNTAAYPWRVHASLLITARDGSRWVGTGWFIGPHTLMTAGHVVYIKNSGVAGRDGWVRKIEVMPGRNGASLPYGNVTAVRFFSVQGWTVSGDETYDYGAIVLPNDLGKQTGWLGFGVYSDAQLNSSVGNISGYPADKASGTQWYDARRIASVGPRKVYYDIDTYGGQSGSAVYRIENGSRYGVAVHAYGGSVTNSGTRISRPVFDNMRAWKA